MLRKIGTIIFQIISLLALTAGVFTLIIAAGVPSKYSLYDASAVQVSQVYSEATYTALMALGFLLLSAVIQLMLYFTHQQENTDFKSLNHDISQLRRMVALITDIMRKRSQNQ
jgi:hypothetical protein